MKSLIKHSLTRYAFYALLYNVPGIGNAQSFDSNVFWGSNMIDQKYKEPKYDTTKGVAMYYDDSLNVLVDSVLVINRADERGPVACPSGMVGCAVYHSGPQWFQWRIIRLRDNAVLDRKKLVVFTD
jgi:hypothetical protein